MKTIAHCLATACTCLVATVTLRAADVPVAEFDAQENARLGWQVVDDGVMGGRSQGEATFDESGILRFSGKLSLENNGGFSSLRTGDIQLDLGGSEGLVARVKGDGRTYQLRLGTDARYNGMEVSFMAGFPTREGEWTEVRVPFSDFVGSFRGRILKDEVFDAGRIRRLGLLLGDKKAGGFDLQVDWIRAYGAREGDIVERALADGRFKTLAAALTEADLVSLLQEEGPFTVFAPTDEAFAALPKGTVETLLKEENLDQLKAILTCHVVAGKVSAGDALNAGSATTVNGNSLGFALKDGSFKVNDATLRSADIVCDNGVIHIIDTVLIPPASTEISSTTTDAKPGVTPAGSIVEAIERGGPAFNRGDHSACADIYEMCLKQLAADERVAPQMREVLQKVLDRAGDGESARDRAWRYRAGLDHAYKALAH